MAWACWYFSLILSVFSIITSAQHSAILHTIRGTKEDTPLSAFNVDRVIRLVSGNVPTRTNKTKSTTKREAVKDGSPAEQQVVVLGKLPRVNYHMIYIWQNPVMLMAWSWTIFILGLILHVTAPLRHDEQTGNNRQSAIFVLTAGGLVILNFGWCSLWMYHAADHPGEEQIGDHISDSNHTEV